jgi:hypothetical protein
MAMERKPVVTCESFSQPYPSNLYQLSNFVMPLHKVDENLDTKVNNQQKVFAKKALALTNTPIVYCG